MNHSRLGLPVHHKLLEFTQTHVHWVGDAIQPSHPLSSPSPPAPNPSQHQGLFQWVNSSHEVAKVLDFPFSVSPSSEHPGLIPFRMNWLDLLAAICTRGLQSHILISKMQKALKGFPGGSDGKEAACNAGDLGLIPWSGWSPGEGHGNSFQYSCLENSMDREPGGLQSMGSQRVRHDWVTNTQTHTQKALKTGSFHKSLGSKPYLWEVLYGFY